MVLKHDRKLDNDRKLEKQAEYYDEIGIADEFDVAKAVKQQAKTKRVNMIIPFQMYVQAMVIGQKTGIGYQNTLKMAIDLGLQKLNK